MCGKDLLTYCTRREGIGMRQMTFARIKMQIWSPFTVRESKISSQHLQTALSISVLKKDYGPMTLLSISTPGEAGSQEMVSYARSSQEQALTSTNSGSL